MFPNRIPCTKTQYMSRFPELTEELKQQGYERFR